jgi:Fe-S oxidoreductase
MTEQAPIFAAIFVVAVIFFLWSCWQRFSLVALGRADNRVNEFGKRVWNMLLYAFGQKRVVAGKYPFGWNHFVFFWCFLLLLMANTEFLFHGIFPGFIALSKLPQGLYYALALVFDIVSLLALLAVTIAISRRLWFAPKYIDAKTAYAFVILGLVAILMLAFFGLHGSEVAMGELNGPDAQSIGAVNFMPVSAFVGKVLFGGIPLITLAYMKLIFWWIHAFALLGFLCYLPYSKHMHILTSIPNCFFKSIDKVNTQTPEEFKKENVYGAGQVDRFRWKDLFDSYSCTECGRCTDNCPATNTGKALNPRLIVHDIKVNLLHNGKLIKQGKGPELPLIGGGKEGSISEDSIWACTTCGACMEVCPVFIEHVPKLVYLRRDLVEMKARFPDELLSLFDNLENRSNPWGIIPAERSRWVSDVNAPAFEKDKTEYLFYTGCAGSLDTRNKRNTEAIARILTAAGVSWGTFGKDEKCCGDSARRLGNEFLFDKMAKENIKALKDAGVKKIITECPHCYNTLKNDYRQFGADFEVIHHAGLILQLVEAKKLQLKNKVDAGKLVFHDSCYLGRYNGVFEQPRKLIEAVTGKAPLEMERRQGTSFCCGAGGGRMWMEETEGTRINMARVTEAMKSDPDAICVCCPYCVTMMEDGLTDIKAPEKVKVIEISELVEKALK